MLTTALAAALLFPIAAQDAAKQAAPLKPWTLLVYGGADNNADGPIQEFLDGVRKAFDGDPGMELVLYIDRSDKFSDGAELFGEDFTGARLYRLGKDSVERLAGGAEMPDITLDKDVEINSSDPVQLKRFIAFGKAHFPARRTGLLIYSHADGRTMCPDEQCSGEMGIPALSSVMTPAESLDFLALELCNMGGIEIAYQWRPGPDRWGADVLVAIPNAGPPLDWDRAFARIRSPGHASSAQGPYLDPAQMDAAAFGNLVIEEGELGRKAMAERRKGAGSHESAGCYDLRAVATVKKSVDALARALAAAPDDKSVFLEMRGPGPIGTAIDYSEGGPCIDLYDLCQRAEACDALSEGVRAACSQVMADVDRFMLSSFGMSAYEGFEKGKHGVFIVLPEQGRDWSWFNWYSPRAGKESWSGNWAFLADGSVADNGKVDTWYELLDSWFDKADDKGGSNGYRP
jgi:clostripain